MTNPSKFLKSFIFLSFLVLFLFIAGEAKACLFDSDCNECSVCVWFSCSTKILDPPGVPCPATLWDAGCSGVKRKGRKFICYNHGCLFDRFVYKCDQSCGAECDGDSDCSDYCQSNTEYFNGQCQSNCTCSYSSRSCGNDFCSGVYECTRFDFYCDGDSCGNRYVTDNSCTNKCPSTAYYCDTSSGGVCDGHKTNYPCVSGSCTGSDSDNDSACSGNTCNTTTYSCDTSSGGVCDGHQTTYTCNSSGGCIGSNSDNDAACSGDICDTTDYYCDTSSGGVCDGHKTTYICNSSGGCIGSDSDDDSDCSGNTCNTTAYYCDTSSGGVCDGHKTTYTCNSSGGCIGSDSDDDLDCSGEACGTRTRACTGGCSQGCACSGNAWRCNTDTNKSCTKYCDGSGNCQSCSLPSCSKTSCGCCADSYCGSCGSGDCAGNYVCNTGTHGCSSSCNTVGNACGVDGTCSAAGECADCTPSGSSCTGDPECCSGYCVDGVCCNNACAGTCERCDSYDGTAGTCHNIADNNDPDNECSTSWNSCDSTCVRRGGDGFCDGAGPCDTNDRIGDIASSYVCTGSGNQTAVSSSNYCNYDENCDAGDCSATQWWTSCNGIGSCRSASDHTDSSSSNVYPDTGYTLTSTCGTTGTTYCATNQCRDGGGWNHKCSQRCDAAYTCNYWIDGSCVDHCTNSVQDCNEGGEDCGGSCPTSCGCNLNKTGDYTVDDECILEGTHHLQSGNLTITTGGYIQMNPGSSLIFDSGYEIRIEGAGYILKSETETIIQKQ